MNYLKLISQIMALFGFLSFMTQCKVQGGNDDNGKITRFAYSDVNSMERYSGEKYQALLTPDGKVQIIIDEGFPTEKELIINDTTIFDELERDVVRKYKMRSYKPNYQPIADITDGSSWSINVTYADNKKGISSYGYMSGPSNLGEAVKAIQTCFKKWTDNAAPQKKITKFAFTCNNAQGQLIDYRMEVDDNGETAAISVYNAEYPINGKPCELKTTANKVYINELDALVKTAGLKKCDGYNMSDSKYMSDSSTTQYYRVDFDDNSFYEGTCYYDNFMDYQGREISAFFAQWLPMRGNLVNFKYDWRKGMSNQLNCNIKSKDNGMGEALKDGEMLFYFFDSQTNKKGDYYEIDKDVLPKLQQLINENGFDNAHHARNPKGTSGSWSIKASFDSGDYLFVNDYIMEDDDISDNLKDNVLKLLRPYLDRQ